MSLKEEIKVLNGNKRKFILMRVADMDVNSVRKILGVTTGTYNTWLQNGVFVAIHRKIAFTSEFKQEAIQMLRRDNQLAAVLLEGQIIGKLKEELESGDYNLLRSQLAREVYSKLISDLDVVKAAPGMTWEQKINILNAPALPQGEIINGELITEGNKPKELSEGNPVTECEQTPGEVEEVPEKIID
jgi:hypothetical protein